MIRIIKFRGYSQEKGWVYGDLNQYSNGECYITEHSDEQSYQVAPESVGQCTGCTDKDGKEIYEGDIVLAYNTKKIVRYGDDNIEDIDGMRTVWFFPGVAYNTSVIGNTYNN